ncbi:MAG TPA: DUF971 domain-containing protein [Alphaproteobacteria bacterium]|nr:DUF971 domain-containing protein [Alphaproteobacteria bacterium]HNS43773.1 DUF971 domain-containing protein [Alphaproteobacteria bacterium]
MTAPHWPTEISYKKSERVLYVTFDTGERFGLTAELLRVESPSAEVQGHRPEEKVTVTNKENVTISAIEPVGNYAVRLVFDDGHNTGLYSWTYLYELAQKFREPHGHVCGCGKSGGCH